MARVSGPIAANTNVQRGASRWESRATRFFAFGDQGQRIVILPSQQLVIVRLGDSVDPTGDIRGLGRLVKEVIEAVQN
jgi:CubicO group peptidase (beta-lactamase class C family)